MRLRSSNWDGRNYANRSRMFSYHTPFLSQCTAEIALAYLAVACSKQRLWSYDFVVAAELSWKVRNLDLSSARTGFQLCASQINGAMPWLWSTLS